MSFWGYKKYVPYFISRDCRVWGGGGGFTVFGFRVLGFGGLGFKGFRV